MTEIERKVFGYACDGLVRMVRDAANPKMREFVPYLGWRIPNAVGMAKEVMRRARRLGLYPTVALLEAETRKAA